jgi:hypothetical protein
MARPWSELRERLPADVHERARKKTEAMLAMMAQAGCSEECEEGGESAAQELRRSNADAEW